MRLFIFMPIVLYSGLLLAQPNTACRLEDKVADFAEKRLNPMKYQVFQNNVSVFSNTSDSSLFDVVFNTYNWQCGEFIKIELIDVQNNVVYEDIKTIKQLKNIYLTYFRDNKELFIIRLDLNQEKYRDLIINPDNPQSYKIKLSASVKGLDKWVTLYGDSELDKRFLFFTPMYADGN